jgi:hypothetical protein
MAVLKEEGKVPSESERFIMVVIGGSRESMHDFRRSVVTLAGKVNFYLFTLKIILL